MIMAGTGLYWGRGETQLLALAEALRIPVFLNGLGRGCVPADHELFFSRARGQALAEADVALVVGVPLDFRLGFGAAFSPDCDVIVIDVAESERDHPRPVSAELYGALPATLEAALAGAAARLRTPAPPGPRSARRGCPRCARSRTRSEPARRPSGPIRGRRCIRCGSTASWPSCSTVTRS